jgi:hypothetical protein
MLNIYSHYHGMIRIVEMERANKILLGGVLKGVDKRPEGYYYGIKKLITNISCMRKVKEILFDNSHTQFVDDTRWEIIECYAENQIIGLSNLEAQGYLPCLIQNLTTKQLLEISPYAISNLLNNYEPEYIKTLDKPSLSEFIKTLEPKYYNNHYESKPQQINTMEWSGKNVLPLT